MVAVPLVLTLRLDRRSFLRLESQRRAFFPPERNLVPAHISIFHALPGEAVDHIHHVLAEVASRRSAFQLRIESLRSLGGGVAYNVRCAELLVLQKRLAAEFEPMLTRQDRQSYHPHITIQNKVPPAEARATLGELQSSFTPFDGAGVGLCLWEYRNGPWSLYRRYRFLCTADAPSSSLQME